MEASYTANLGNCLLRVRRTVVGELTGNDAAALQLHAQITIETDGSDCDGTPYVAGMPVGHPLPRHQGPVAPT